MSDPVYLIDSEPVNDRVDWVRTEITGDALGRRETGFPGIPERFVSKSGVMPDDLRITGFLEATGATWSVAVEALRAQIATLQQMKGANATYSVEFNGSSYSAMELMSFKVSGTYQRRSRGELGENKLALVAVEFVWRKLA